MKLPSPSVRTSSITRACVRFFLRVPALVAGVLLLAACTTTSMQPSPRGLVPGASWGLLPIVNYTQTPQAGLRAEAILESLVRARGAASLRRYPSELNVEALFEPTERNAVDKAMRWARTERVRYALTGTVDEWRYKVGVDGEPAVGITLQLVDVVSGDVVWSATGAKTGWSRESLSGVAQKLIRELTSPLAGLGGVGTPGAAAAPATTAAGGAQARSRVR